jgi:ribosome-interacting GTPase 1
LNFDFGVKVPANLPPEYFEAERKFKEASTPVEKAEALEHLISTIPKHKGTDKLRADYRKKLSKIHIEKEGAGRIVVVGMPNVGKSSLVSALTHAKPEVSEYPYTTWLPVPGMVEYQNIHLQLIDTPPLDKEHVEQELIELIKTADLILLMIDLSGSI